MDNSQKKILVAEDDAALNEMLVMVLKDEEYQVDFALNGQEAWDLINNNEYDLLATDLFMPQMNGIDLIKKCQQSYPKIKILLLCGGGKELEATHKNPYIKFNNEEIKTHMFMRKPYNLSELLSVVEDLLAE